LWKTRMAIKLNSFRLEPTKRLTTAVRAELVEAWFIESALLQGRGERGV